MKKQILIAAAVLFSAGMLFITGCKKDDTAAPVVTLVGNSSLSFSLNTAASAATDPGATATDEKDGTLTSSIKSDWSTTNPNLAKAGTYTIKYTVSDAAGNEGSTTRTVYVMHTSSTTAGSFAVTDVVGASTTTYTEVITAAATSTVRLNTTRFGNYDNTIVYFDLSGATGTTVTVPSQTVTNSGNPAATRVFSGTGSVSADGKTITISYTETTNGTTANGTGTYVKP